MTTTPAKEIDRNRDIPDRRESAWNTKPFWFRAALVTDVGVPVRLGAVGAVMLSVAGALGSTDGSLAPIRLTQDRMMPAFHDTNSTHIGFRRNRAKGVGLKVFCITQCNFSGP